MPTLPSALGEIRTLSVVHPMTAGGVLAGEGQLNTTWSNSWTVIVPEVPPWMGPMSVQAIKTPVMPSRLPIPGTYMYSHTL